MSSTSRVMNSEFEKEEVKHPLEVKLVPLAKASGGTCIAYTTRLFGKKVFIKEIKPELADDARMHSAFRKEAEIGFRLDHPHIPKYIYAEGVLPSERFIVQEFIDGQTLPDFIEENPAYFQNKKNIVRFILEFADVIDYLHLNQIVHLDLKPENILITRIGNSIKLTDLGFCASDFYDDTRGLTVSELAPEGAINPEARGMESDYYGLGKILTYIRNHTPGFPQKRFRKLEERLLFPQPTKRLTSKDGIEKALENRSNKGGIWLLALTVALLFVIIGSIFYGRPSGQSGENTSPPPMAGSSTIADMEDPIDETETGIIPAKEIPTEKSAGRPPTENYSVAEGDNNYSFSPQTYENLKAEMAENIYKNFAEFRELLNTFLLEKRFNKEDYNTLDASYRTAIHKTFETSPYKTKYPDLSPSLIDDTMAELLQDIENKNWAPAFKRYVEQYQELAGDASK